MRSRLARRRPGFAGVLVALAAAGALVASPALGASRPATSPPIRFGAAGGSVVVKVDVHLARICRFSSVPPIAGFAASLPCHEGELRRRVRIAPNPLATARQFVLDVEVVEATGTVARGIVVLEAGRAPQASAARP